MTPPLTAPIRQKGLVLSWSWTEWVYELRQLGQDPHSDCSSASEYASLCHPVVPEAVRGSPRPGRRAGALPGVPANPSRKSVPALAGGFESLVVKDPVTKMGAGGRAGQIRARASTCGAHRGCVGLPCRGGHCRRGSRRGKLAGDGVATRAHLAQAGSN